MQKSRKNKPNRAKPTREPEGSRKAEKESGNIQLKAKKVNEDPIEVKGPYLTSIQRSRACVGSF